MIDKSYWIGYSINVELSQADLRPYADNDLHITLAYLGKDVDRKSFRKDEEMNQVVESLTKLVRFYPERLVFDGQHVTLWHNEYLILEGLNISTRVREARRRLTDELYRHDIWYSTKYFWNPHITLDKGEDVYDPNSDYLPIVNQTIVADRLFFHTPNTRIHWNLHS